MRRLAAAILGAFLALTAAASPAMAAEPAVTGMRLQGAENLTIGDQFRIVITVEADAGTTVSLAPGALPNELSLVDTPKVTTRSKGNGRIEIKIDMLVAPFFIGDYPMPPLTLRYRQGSTTGDIQTPAAQISVRSTLPQGAQIVPRDLKPQAEIGFPPSPPYVLIALAVAVLALSVVLGLLYWRVRRPEPVIEEPRPDFLPVGPEDRARLALDSIAASFATDQDHVSFYAALAGTIRGYLSDRYSFPAYALTTLELQDRTLAVGMDRWQARLVAGLLEQCDSVIYANYRPAASRIDADLTAAYEIVEMSRPAGRAREVEVMEVSLP
jgi:hypothetical protein